MDILVPQPSLPMSIRQELDRRFLNDCLIKSVLGRALAALPRVISQYKCDTCEKSFSSFQGLGGHKSIHNANNKRTRDHHEPTSKKILVQKSHKPRPRTSETETAASDMTFKCSVCSKAFSSYQALGGHTSIHNANNKRSRDEPTSKKILVPKSRKRPRTSDDQTGSDITFKCSVCSRAFSSYQALGGHSSIHKRTSILECASSCPKETEEIDLELRL